MNRKNIESQNFYYRDGEPVKDAELLSTLEVFQFDDYVMHVVTEKNQSLTQVFTDADHNGFFQISGVKILDPNVLDTHTTSTKYGQNTHWVEIEGKKVEVFEFKIKEIPTANIDTQQQPTEPPAKRARIDEESQPAIQSDDIAQMIKNAGLGYMLEQPEQGTLQETTLPYNNSIFDDDALDRLFAATDSSPDEIPEQVGPQISPANNQSTHTLDNIDGLFATRIGSLIFREFLSRVNNNLMTLISRNKESMRINITVDIYNYLKTVMDQDEKLRDHLILKTSKGSRFFVEINIASAKRLNLLYSNYMLRNKSTLVSDVIANRDLFFSQPRSSLNNLGNADILRNSDGKSFTPKQ